MRSRHSSTFPLPATDGTPLGVLGEQLAAAHLTQDDGLEVVACNWRLSSGELRGELDIVALDHRHRAVVVTEVKTRTSLDHGGPLAAVTPRKQAKVRSLTAVFLREAALPYRRVRLDVVGVLLPRRGPARIDHVAGAF